MLTRGRFLRLNGSSLISKGLIYIIFGDIIFKI
jgi:hypothetical protein